MRRSVAVAVVLAAVLAAVALLWPSPPEPSPEPRPVAAAERPRAKPPRPRWEPPPPAPIVHETETEPEPEPTEPRVAVATIEGRVVDERGRPVHARVHACGDWADVDEHGRFEVVTGPGSCSLVAARGHGSLTWYGAEIVVDLAAGATVPVTLTVPDWEPAGMGFAFEVRSDGIAVRRVWPDTPAADAGLRRGDLVVEVDGQLTAGMEWPEFLSWALGPPGSEVTLRVRGPDGERDVVFVRERIDVEGS